MSVLVKRSGAWVNSTQPYVKRSDVWVAATGVYQKMSGAWVQVWSPPQPAPPAPVLELEIMPNKFYRVGVRHPFDNHNPNIVLIRVLASRTAFPATQFSSGFYSEPDNQWPNEPWSEWRFTSVAPPGLGSIIGHEDTSVIDQKQWPPNTPTGPGHELPKGDYFFAAWTLDNNGNWSQGVFNQSNMPAGGTSTGGTLDKKAKFKPTTTGKFQSLAFTVNENDIEVQRDVSVGALFYGNQIRNSIGQNGDPTVTSATLTLTRQNDAFAHGNARVTLAWHGELDPDGDYVAGGDREDTTFLGAIAKGQTRDFELPASFLPHLTNDIGGFVLTWSTPSVDTDSATFLGIDRSPIAGELTVNWREEY